MSIDRKMFFAGVKRTLIPTLTQSQVDGLDFLLDEFEKHAKLWVRTGHIAYALATTMHETAASFQPVEEGYYLGGSRVLAFQRTLRYYPYFGRGFVQLTWEANYDKATIRLRQEMPNLVADFERDKQQEFNLAKFPSQAKNKYIAFGTMTLGMSQGWFRAGHTLERYIGIHGTDYFNAREIINGDKNHFQRGATITIGQTIANYAKRFEAILRVSRPDDIPAINSATEFAKTSHEETFAAPLPLPEPEPTGIAAPVDQNEATAAADVNTAASETPAAISPEQQAVPPPISKVVEETKTEQTPEGTVETKTTTSGNSAVAVTPEKPSLWSYMVAGGTTAYGYYKLAKEDFGNLVDRATDAVDIHFVLNLVLGAGLVGLGAYLYNKSRSRADSRTAALIKTAADQTSNTVILKPKWRVLEWIKTKF